MRRDSRIWREEERENSLSLQFLTIIVIIRNKKKRIAKVALGDFKG